MLHRSRAMYRIFPCIRHPMYKMQPHPSGRAGKAHAPAAGEQCVCGGMCVCRHPSVYKSPLNFWAICFGEKYTEKYGTICHTCMLLIYYICIRDFFWTSWILKSHAIRLTPEASLCPNILLCYCYEITRQEGWELSSTLSFLKILRPS